MRRAPVPSEDPTYLQRMLRLHRLKKLGSSTAGMWNVSDPRFLIVGPGSMLGGLWMISWRDHEGRKALEASGLCDAQFKTRREALAHLQLLVDGLVAF